MHTGMALRRFNDLMDEIESLKREINQTENARLEGIWSNISVSEEDIEESQNRVLRV